jgi:hypothetical protein
MSNYTYWIVTPEVYNTECLTYVQDKIELYSKEVLDMWYSTAVMCYFTGMVPCNKQTYMNTLRSSSFNLGKNPTHNSCLLSPMYTILNFSNN